MRLVCRPCAFFCNAICSCAKFSNFCASRAPVCVRRQPMTLKPSTLPGQWPQCWLVSNVNARHARMLNGRSATLVTTKTNTFVTCLYYDVKNIVQIVKQSVANSIRFTYGTQLLSRSPYFFFLFIYCHPLCIYWRCHTSYHSKMLTHGICSNVSA